jgi:hypothetical protein
MDKSKITLISALLALLLTSSASAQSLLASVPTICSQLTNTAPILSNTTGQGQLLLISLILLLVMLFVSIGAYMLGRAFDINLLLKFSRDEMREIAVTALVVIVFLGSFTAISGSAGLGGFVLSKSGTSSSTVFSADCNSLATSSLNMVGTWVAVSTYQQLFMIVQSVYISIQPGDMGPAFNPFSGVSILTDPTDGMITNFAMFAGVLAVFTMAIAVMLGIFYTLFPLFLYVGIVLRTIPFTRAAGGAFLGLFIAFYFVFPFLMYFFISPYSQATINSALPSATSLIMPGGDTNPLGAVTSGISQSLSGLGSSAMLPWFMDDVADPAIFLVLAVVFSLMISMDFMESLGDMLGSPSLSQRGALRGLI